jgi:hypothetical protein
MSATLSIGLKLAFSAFGKKPDGILSRKRKVVVFDKFRIKMVVLCY